MTLPPAQLLPFATTTTDVQLVTGSFVLCGWSLVETTGSASTLVNLIDGASTTAPLIAAISLTQSQSTRDWLSGNGILIRTGILLDVVSGSVRGSLWIMPITHELDIEYAVGDWGPVFVRPGA